MRPMNLLAEAKSAGVIVTVNGDRLHVKGPKRAAAIIQKLAQYKMEVMLALAAATRTARLDNRPAMPTATGGPACKPTTVFSPEYRYGPRNRLVPGDHFRVSAGPYYVLSDGRKIAMGEKGTMVFRQYCQRGTDHWIEAYRADGGGVAILTVGEQRASPVDGSFQRRPHRVRKIINRV